jgi:hypothetical protein
MRAEIIYYGATMERKIDSFDFWYAVNNTDVMLLPEKNLETFGTTVLNYHLITELMDSVGQVRIREGRMEAGKPQIMTPSGYMQTDMEGFGEEAQKYIDWLKEHEQDIKVLQYSYELKQESFSEHVVTDNMESVTKRVHESVKASNDPMSAVLIGVDDLWDVSLICLFRDVIQKSAGFNIQEMQKHNLFEQDNGVPRHVRNTIDDAFKAANKDSSLINGLGTKLQGLGVFDEYEDRFFSLVKSNKEHE